MQTKGHGLITIAYHFITRPEEVWSTVNRPGNELVAAIRAESHGVGVHATVDGTDRRSKFLRLAADHTEGILVHTVAGRRGHGEQTRERFGGMRNRNARVKVF